MKLVFDIEDIYENLSNPSLELDEKLSLNYLSDITKEDSWKKSQTEIKPCLDEFSIDGSSILLPPPFISCQSIFTRIKDSYSVLTSFYCIKIRKELEINKKNFLGIKKKKRLIYEDKPDFSQFHEKMKKECKNNWISMQKGSLNYILRDNSPYMISGMALDSDYFISMGMSGSSKRYFNKKDFSIDMNEYCDVINLFANIMFNKETKKKTKDIEIKLM